MDYNVIHKPKRGIWRNSGEATGHQGSKERQRGEQKAKERRLMRFQINGNVIDQVASETNATRGKAKQTQRRAKLGLAVTPF